MICYGSTLQLYTNYLKHNDIALIMLGKLSQIKNFISQAVTSINSQRPTPPNDPQLDSKLKYLLDHIFRHPTQQQFRVYHSLQSPEMTVNQLLSQIYHSQYSDTTQIASILHFFTFLLINCNNQLVLCKIVSDSFVLELTQVDLHSLGRNIINENIEIEEINSYKIALIKAYVSRINQETIKYMVINDRMKILENCVALYEQHMKVEEQQQFGVEATCISNCILLIVRYLAAHPEYSPNICYQEGEKGIVYLLRCMVENIHSSMLSILNSCDLEELQFQLLKDKILFLVDLVNSISSQEIKIKIISETSKKLTDLRDLFKQIVLQHTAIFSQNKQNYIKSLELIKVLLKLLAIYYDSESLLPLFSESLLPLLHKFIHVFKTGCKAILVELTELKKQNSLQEKQMEMLLDHKEKLVYIFCSNMEIVASIINSGEYMRRRNNSQQKEKELKTIIINILIDVMELLLGEEGQSIQELVCYKSIKFLLLSLMQLTLENQHTLHEYSVVKFHQFVIEKLKKHLKKVELWDYLVLNYESFLKLISQNLLSIQDTSPHQYSFCQFHDPNKIKIPFPIDTLTNAIFINQCCRNFRFMIVQKTGVSLKDIKLQKNYHNNFITRGWEYQPGKQITEPIIQICHLSHLSRGINLSISIVEDEDCLLFAHFEGDTKKILLNIRYKSIEGFTVQKEVVHIKLKGLQEVLVEANSKKQKDQVRKFKQYLIKKRDKSRERELKFIHHYLDLYYQDNLRLILQMGEAEIQTETDNNTFEEKLAIVQPIDPPFEPVASEPEPEIEKQEAQKAPSENVDDL